MLHDTDKDVLNDLASFCNKRITFFGNTLMVDDINRIHLNEIQQLRHDHGELVDLFCVGVPGKAFFIRKNGHISVTGNTLHAESMIKLFRTFIEENKHIWKDQLKKQIYTIAEKMVELEDKFIDLAFSMGPLQDLTAEQVKQYIRYIADRRLISLGLKGIFKVKKNPLPWVEMMINAPEHTNFFENRSTSYARGAMQGDWSDVWARTE